MGSTRPVSPDGGGRGVGRRDALAEIIRSGRLQLLVSQTRRTCFHCNFQLHGIAESVHLMTYLAVLDELGVPLDNGATGWFSSLLAVTSPEVRLPAGRGNVGQFRYAYRYPFG
jgi:hypothetical protein